MSSSLSLALETIFLDFWTLSPHEVHLPGVGIKEARPLWQYIKYIVTETGSFATCYVSKTIYKPLNMSNEIFLKQITC